MKDQPMDVAKVAAVEIGPRAYIVTTMTCTGCPALITERWKDYLENDETDSGTSATCSAAGGRSITAYWSNNRRHPDWCPAVRNHIIGDDQ